MKCGLAMALLLVLCFRLQAQENPVFTVTAGSMYLNADQHAATRASFNGWYVIPEYHVTKTWSMIAEATGFTGPAWVAGLGANVKLAKRGSLQPVPGEYILTTPAHGALHNYGAHAGVVGRK